MRCVGGISAVCDAAERNSDRQFVDEAGIVIVGPFLVSGVIRVAGIGDCLERFAEARDAAAVLGWRASFAPDIS